MRLPIIVAIGLVLASSMRARAQDEVEFQSWTAVLSTVDLAEPGRAPALWLDVHVRRGEAGTVHLFRPGIGYAFAPWLSTWIGYAWTPLFRNDGAVINEQRAWQQVIVQQTFAERLALQARTRLEQRFHESPGGVGLRVRQFVRAGLRLTSDAVLHAVVWDELFVGLNEPDWGQPSGLDQNRLFIGPALAPASWARVEIGYLFVYLDRSPDDTLIHALATNLFLNL